MQAYKFAWLGHELILGGRTAVMGIVNVTPDSFSDGGRFHSFDAAVKQGLQLANAGADIIDVGGESTRPFADTVSETEERNRVIPVIKALAAQVTIPISIDTTKAAIAAAALDAGASIINDISALRMDTEMAAVAAQATVPVIVMHMQGMPGNMQLHPVYEDVVAEVHQFLSTTIDNAMDRGIQRHNLIVDPGIGFGKTGHHNLLLLKGLKNFEDLGVPILIGTSRKRFIRNILKAPGQKDMAPDLPEVETGTQASMAAGVINGAHIVRVHNVANTRAMLDVLDAIRLA